MIPQIDLTQDETQASQQLMAALSEFGFARIARHGISSALISQAYRQTQLLFDLALEEKQSYALTNLGERGYTGFAKETAVGHSQADLKEFWHIGPEGNSDYPANLWPQQLPDFQGTMLALYNSLDELASQILRLVARELDVPTAHFDALTQGGNSVLRLLHYPPLKQLDQSQLNGAMRAAPHTDINLLTLLIGASTSGLQIHSKQGEWIDIEHESDDIIIDTGDMMALLTDNQLPSTTHRVVNQGSDQAAILFLIMFF